MTASHSPGLDETIELLLRGAAAILGCNSASLLMLDESSARIFVLVGVLREGYPMLSQVERILGDSTRGLSIPVERARGSIVTECLERREVLETSSVADIAGQAFPRPIVRTLDRMVGPRRFLCVPTMSATHTFGVLLFERPDPSPFGAGTRDLLLRYAARIAGLLENDLLQRRTRPADEDLGAFRERLLRLVSEDMAPALLVDQSRRVVAANSAAVWLCGVSAAALSGRPLSALFAPGEPVDGVLDSQLVLQGETSPAPPLELVLAGDGRLPVALHPLLLVDAEGASVGLVVQLSPALRDNDQESRAARRQGDWKTVLRRERLATLGELAAQLAHEVRNPLVAVGAALETLAADYAHDAGLSEELSLLNRELVRVDLILRDYLTMAGRHRITLERLDLAPFLEESARVARAHRRAAGRTLRVACPPGLTLRADRDGLRQVLLNLWLNAFEASPDGAAVECEVSSERGRVVIQVADRGCGLPASGDPFEPFFTTKANGTGLGLTVCRRIVAAHGGALGLQPREGGGTVARLVLPRRPGGVAVARTAAEAAAEAAPGGPPAATAATDSHPPAHAPNPEEPS
jgi:signal transduction histidine kinase